MNKGFTSIVIGGFSIATVLLTGTGIIYSAQTSTRQKSPAVSKPAPISKSKLAAQNSTYEKIKAELKMAQKSGGISPTSYNSILKRINDLEKQKYNSGRIKELRQMLSKLSVGGKATIKFSTTTPKTPSKPTVNSTPTTNTPNTTTETGPKIVRWDYTNGKWQPSGTPPACPDPLVLQLPMDLNRATGVLYPGQIRGNDFKPHGGFHTTAGSPVQIRAPLEGYVTQVAKFYDAAGLHYMYDIQHPCGIMIRLGHLASVPDKFEQSVFQNFPKREFGDSRTEMVSPYYVGLGEVLANDTQGSTGFDWGVYDLRKENQASQDPTFRESYKYRASQSNYAICWLDYLPADVKQTVKNLPGVDYLSGKTSAYCK